MSIWQITMLSVVAALYAGTGLVYGWRGDYALAVFWLCYATANVAYIAALK